MGCFENIIKFAERMISFRRLERRDEWFKAVSS